MNQTGRSSHSLTIDTFLFLSCSQSLILLSGCSFTLSRPTPPTPPLSVAACSCLLLSLSFFQLKDNLKTFFTPMTFYLLFNQVLEKKHSTITAALKAVNDISVACDKKQHCASLFIDLSKSFETVDCDLLKCRLLNTGLSEQAVAWFQNYLSGLSALNMTVFIRIIYPSLRVYHRVLY